MTLAKLAILVGACALAAAALPAVALQSPDAKAPASSAPAAAPAAAIPASPATAQDADDTAALIAKANAAAAANAKSAQEAAKIKGPIEPSANAAKKAREFGFHAEIYDGKTMFCKDDATLGTRIKAKRCMDAVQFEDYAVQLQYARDTLHKDVCQGGNFGVLKGPCGGLQ